MSNLDAALFCAKNGLYVFPCREKEGEPYLDKKGNWITPPVKSPYTHSGFKDATIDENQIKKWWSNGHKNAAIGVDCTLSKLAVIDIDMKGKDGMSNYHSMGIDDEGCWHNLTPNNGLHIIFDDPDGIAKPSTNKKKGIDIRGHGSYFIIAPSFLIIDGKKKYYTMLDDITIRPKKITPEIIEKFQPKGIKKEKRIIIETKDEKRRNILYNLNKIPIDVLDDYTSWIEIGMALQYELGQDGFELWEDVTEPYFEMKPNSKRRGKLEYYWEHFRQDKDNLVTGATIWHFANNKEIE